MSETKSVTIGERTFTLSPITMGIVRKSDLPDPIAIASQMQVGVLPKMEQVTAMMRIVHASAAVAEPELTFDAFADVVDQLEIMEAYRDIVKAFGQLMVLSRMHRRVGEGDPAGGSESP